MMKTDYAEKIIILSQNFSDFKYSDNTYLHNTPLFQGSLNAIRDYKGNGILLTLRFALWK